MFSESNFKFFSFSFFVNLISRNYKLKPMKLKFLGKVVSEKHIIKVLKVKTKLKKERTS